MSGYVSTRYYRAPEIMLTWGKYDVKVDIWSAACILAEMLQGRPLFPGKDHVNQFSIITELLGNPPDEVVQDICSENVRVISGDNLCCVDQLLDPPIRPIAPKERKAATQCQISRRRPSRYDLRTVNIRLLTCLAIDLLDNMLVFNPKMRVKATDALAHEYFSPYHDPDNEPVAEEEFDWSFNDADLPVDTWKIML